MKPQTLAVLDALRIRPTLGLTPAEARDLIGTDRLAARVGELRAEGFDVTTTYVTVRGARFARYHLIEEAQLTAFSGAHDTNTGSPSAGVVRSADGRRAATAGTRFR